MKLLFDQNLSPRLPNLLTDLYPNSLHVRAINLHDATDTEIWNYAQQNGFILVSKDSDFQQRSLLYGSPPKFIWIRLGKFLSSGDRKLASFLFYFNTYICS